MTGRVLSTDHARAAVGRVQAIVDSELVERLARLRAEGATLSDPNVWDGMEATRFRSELWPSTSAALQQAIEALQHLQARVQIINHNIMVAGGNA